MYVWDSTNEQAADNYAVFSKELELPFAPFNGLEIGFPSTRGWRVKSVCWLVETCTFLCFIEDLFTNSYELDELTFEEWIETLASDGWSCFGPHPKQS